MLSIIIHTEALLVSLRSTPIDQAILSKSFTFIFLLYLSLLTRKTISDEKKKLESDSFGALESRRKLR
jgi:hypothetical protein